MCFAATWLFVASFAYIAYIDTETMLRVFVKEEQVKDMFKPDEYMNHMIYLPELTTEENIDRAMRTLRKWYLIDLSIPFIVLSIMFGWTAWAIQKEKKGPSF